MYVQRKEDGNTDFSLFLLVLPFIIYGIDAGLNFPVARPLMQSALALYMGLLLSIYLNRFTSKEVKPIAPKYTKIILGLSLMLLIPGIIIHVLSFQSLTQQGRLLYEFNNGTYNLTLAELDEIEDDFDFAYKNGILKLPVEAKFGVYMAYRYYRRLLKKLKAVPSEKIMDTRIRISDPMKINLLARSYVKYKLNII